MARPKFDKESFPTAVIRERVDELTLRQGEEGMLRSFTNTYKVEAGRRRPPLVDEDWHAACQATHKFVEGVEWENLYYKSVEMKQGIDVRHPSGSGGVRTLWKLSDDKESGEEYNDQASEQNIANREAVRPELWNKHLLTPALALAEALRRVEAWDDAGSSTTGRNRT